MIHYRYDTLNFGRAKLQNPNVKRIIRIASTAILLLISLTSAGPARDSYRIKTVVIDAGHGGHDSGCLGASAKEKHVALDIALRLGKMIESNYPDIKVVYTRKTDVFIPLHERANIANRAHADLFICIHLNSGGKGAYGSETYVMGNHKTEDNLNVAKRENAAILLEDDYQKKYDGFDPNSPEANIIFSLYQSQFMNQSLMLASNIQEEFTDYAGRYNRGVKQAGFLVLYKTAMPAVLIECGFLTHEPEEKFLNNEKGQGTMATAIFRAFKEYKIDMESGGESSTPEPVGQEPRPDPRPDPVPPPVTKDTVIKTPVAETAPVKTNPAPEKTTPPPPPSPKPAIKEPVVSEAANPAVYITIQIGASKNPQVDNTKYAKMDGVRPVACSDGFTRYFIGSFQTVDAARKKLAQVKASGKSDAFLTAMNGNQRITLPEAEQLLKRP
jgi:N-acetylmuramoyl-L-alanine amidase